MNELYHHGILGMKWGVRRYQNPDGTLTEAGRTRLEKKDTKWARKNYKKIYNYSYKKSTKELARYDRSYEMQVKKGKAYINSHNQKMAELMSSAASKYTTPSGKAVRFVAKRGDMGVYMALADRDYDMSQVKNGVWSSGRVAYKKNVIEKK